MKKQLKNLKSKLQYFNAKQVAYSQEGEDLILNRAMGEKKNGFYIDIGAHHPVRFSNTYFFYKKGWRGINVDAMPGSMKAFNLLRPKDTNIEAAISSDVKELNYYVFNEPALNGFSKELSEQRTAIKEYRIEKVIPIKTTTLASIVEKYVPQNQPIDFLTVDVEGLDLEVLKTANWKNFRPKYILIEILGKNFEEILKSEISVFLKEQNYSLFAKAINTCFFEDKSTLS
jgi:FkbM family methyltransferase